MVTPHEYFDLIESFPEPGCAVCRLLQRDATRHIDALLYQYIYAGQIAPELRAGRGLCNLHSAQMLNYQGRALGIAVVCDWVLDEVRKVDARTGPGQSPSGLGRWFGKPSSALADALEPTGPCLACALMDDAEGRYCSVIVRYLDNERFMTAFHQSAGLCLPHVRLVLRQTASNAQAEAFMAVQRPKWEALHAELREFIRKYDINNADEVMGEEGDSWKRAIGLLMGENGVFGLRR